MDIRTTGQKTRELLGVALGAVILVIILNFVIDRTFFDSSAGRRSPSTTSAAGTILLTESGAGTAVHLLDVPDRCAAQRLEYVASRLDADRSAAITFVVTQGNDEVRVTGPKDVARDGDTRGVGVWSLDDGRLYSFTVYSDNADWMALVRCR